MNIRQKIEAIKNIILNRPVMINMTVEMGSKMNIVKNLSRPENKNAVIYHNYFIKDTPNESKKPTFRSRNS